MKPRRRFAALLGVALASTVALAARDAAADPSVWMRARLPETSRRLALVAEAEELQLRHRHAVRHGPRTEAVASVRFLLRARDLLEQADAASSRDPRVRLRLGVLYHQLKHPDKAAKVLETIVKPGKSRAMAAPSPPVLAEAWGELAICYALLGRHGEEIVAYAQALSLEPHPHARATLLANRAEAYMVLGELSSAIEGYRGALSLLVAPAEMVRFAPTTLWGLAVALDRSGDLDAGLEAIRLARTYDRLDERINGDDWFYVPPYDKHWYAALGHWAVARRTDSGAVRADAFERAVSSWETYIAKAAPEDKWIAIAKARHRQCQKERDAARKATLAALKSKARGRAVDERPEAE